MRIEADVDAQLQSAEIAVGQRDLKRAIALYSAVIDQRPDQPLAYYKRGNLLKDSGSWDAALASYDQAIALDPGHANAYCNRGVVLERLNRLELAQASYDQAIKLNPQDLFAYYNRAGVFRALSRPDKALADYASAISLGPSYADAYCNRGLLLTELKRWEEALASYRQCIEINPGFHQAHFNRGVLLKDLGQLDAALASYDTAIQHYPEYADAYCNRGVVLADLRRWEDALASYDQAIALKPDLAEAYRNRGDALLQLNRGQEVIANYDRALALDPAANFLLGARQNAKMSLCDWSDLESDLGRLAAAITADAKASHPLFVLGLIDSPSLQEKAATTWVREMYPADGSLGPLPKRARREKVRIGYFSADFCEHAIAHLIAGLIDAHDRSLFEVIGFSLGPDTQDRYRQRFESSFDRFIDVRTKSNLEIAVLSRELEIDIAIDLGGHTRMSRTGAFAMRVAPLQVAYLGYPGSMGAEYFDYVIADQTVVPPGSERYFGEKIIYLPHSYQVNDSTRVIAGREFTRPELGLPEDAFVFCSFNNTFKILPTIFDSWMRILKRVPGSVLWLLATNETAVSHLRQHALARGVEPSRLVFAPRMAPPEHLARQRAANLFLDTLPYNAHTTASDALWAGLPVLTCSGEGFAARVAASLLRAIDLPELIVPTLEHYEQLAVELASDPSRLSGIRARLAAIRLTKPLFDTQLFATHIEAAYASIQERYLADLPPAALHIAPLATR